MIFCVVAVWVAGAGAAAPILFNMKLKVEISEDHIFTSQTDCLQVEALPARAVELLGVESRLYCFEKWGTDQVILRLVVRCSYHLDHLSHDTSHTFTIRPQGRLYYSLAVAGVQFLLPSSVLALVHASIYHKLTQVAIYLSAFVSPLVMWCGIV